MHQLFVVLLCIYIMEIEKSPRAIGQIIQNTQRLLGLAWRMDRRITTLYYLTAVVGAIVPVASAYALKLLIDHLQIAQNSLVETIPVIIAVVLAARYLVFFLDNAVYWGINKSYLDYVFRYKLQNEISLKFHQKVSKLDIAYFEDSKAQDLLTKTRDTMLWRLPDYLRTFADFFRDIIAFIFAFIILLPFGWWIPLFVSVVAIPP